MNRRRALLLLVLFSGVLGLAATGLRVVQPGEQMVVRRFGRLVQPAWEPGLHWGLPLGLDCFDRVRTDVVRRLVVGTKDTDEAGDNPAAGEFVTGDLNLVRVQAIVQYRVAGAAEMVVATEGLETMLDRLAEASLSRTLARRDIDSVIRGDRRQIGQEMEGELQAAVSSDRLGLQILGVSLTEARPPAEVAADFAAVQSAESQRARRSTEAHTQAETILSAARATAQARLEAARASSHRRLVSARSRAGKFLALLGEAQKSRELTIQRLYSSAMNSLLGKVRRKIIVPPGDVVDLTVLGVQD
jgi:membrane protease subunit HflK